MNALSNPRATTVHHALRAAVHDRRAADHRIAVLLAEVARDGLHLAHGHTSIVRYAAEVTGFPARQVRELLRLGRALPSLPALDAAFAAGDLGWTKARELLRVATPENEAAWVERAKAVDSRELEDLLRVTHMGQLPPAEVGPEKGPARTRLVFEVEASEVQVIRDAIALVRAQAGVHRAELADGALLAMIAQRVLASEPEATAPTGERYRVVLEHCPSCGTCAGREHEASETVVLEATCDAEVVDGRPGPDRGRLTRTIPPKVRRAVVHRDRERCRVPGCRCTLWVTCTTALADEAARATRNGAATLRAPVIPRRLATSTGATSSATSSRCARRTTGSCTTACWRSPATPSDGCGSSGRTGGWRRGDPRGSACTHPRRAPRPPAPGPAAPGAIRDPLRRARPLPTRSGTPCTVHGRSRRDPGPPAPGVAL